MSSGRSMSGEAIIGRTSEAARVYHAGPPWRPASEWLWLAAILAIGALVRFWNLGFKALWLDEVITALVCLGRGPADLPVGIVLPFARVAEVMTPAPDAGASAVVAVLQDPRVQHTHPPLFYLLMNAWYRWHPPHWSTLAWDLRVVPAALGVASIVSMYALLRTAFRGRPDTARFGAAAMAVSPLMLLLAQEARNYTLAMLVLPLALLATLRIGRAFAERHGSGPGTWTAWILLNAAGCYTHYYFVFASAAECLTLAALFHWGPSIVGRSGGPERPGRQRLALVSSAAAVAALFAPWMPTLLSHLGSPIQAWMALSNPAGHLARAAAGPVVMIVAGPGADLPEIVTVVWAIGSVVTALAVAAAAWRGGRRAAADPASRLAVATFALLLVATLAELVTLSLLRRENLLIEPRYAFVWYPSVCALMAIGLSSLEIAGPGSSLPSRLGGRRTMMAAVLAAGVASAVAVDGNFSFTKAYHPREVAENINRQPADRLVLGYSSYHEMCIGLSYAIALQQGDPAWRGRAFAFVRRSAPEYDNRGRDPSPDLFWQRVGALSSPDAFSGVWVIAPGLSAEDFPPRTAFGGAGTAPCTLDPAAVFNASNNIRGASGEWRARRRLTPRSSYEYAFYRCGAGGVRPRS
ncbi:MAG: glycosyltransferase family 39 protein [Acidobacteria bacterium]|nr:glycosyltransferase family 39 protein [Acidobacteriota bacterium]